VKLEGTEQKVTPTRHKPIRENRKKIRGGSKLSKKEGPTAFFGSSIGGLDQDLAKNPSQL